MFDEIRKYHRVWYFGCHREAGHYLFRMDGGGSNIRNDDSLGLPTAMIDGTFAPMDKIDGLWRILAVWGSRGRVTVAAGWDNSVDTRPGSNAAFFAEGHVSRGDLMKLGKEKFPEQYSRIFESGRNIVWEPEPPAREA